MKEIRPEDLLINQRFIGGNESKAKQNLLGDDTSLNCQTEIPCDTENNCFTVLAGCGGTDTCNCHETTDCNTSACGDTRTKAEICCPMTIESACLVFTKPCKDTELCLDTMSSDTVCVRTDFCSTNDDCNWTAKCVKPPVPDTAVDGY